MQKLGEVDKSLGRYGILNEAIKDFPRGIIKLITVLFTRDSSIIYPIHWILNSFLCNRINYNKFPFP